LWRATDQAGNVTQVRQYINVFEETLPLVRAQNVTVRLVNGQATVTAAQVNNGSSDNCGLAYMALSRTYFTAADLGPNPVTLFVWDRSRNLDSAQAVVTVLPAAPTSGPARYRLHAGGGPVTTSLGTFAADEYAAGGAVFTTDQAVAGTTDDALYQTERYGSFTYNLPVPNGQYTVRLHFAELYWNTAGQRVFNVAAEGSPVLTAYDIVKKVGALTATTESFSVTVTDGVLSLAFAPGATGVDQPKVSAIEVLSGSSVSPVAAARPAASPLAAVASAKLSEYSAQVKLYPNPSTDGRVTVELPAAFQGEVSYTLVSSQGTTLSQGQRTVSAAGQSLTFDFSHQLAAEGLYYLHLRGAKGQAHVKLLRK
jgi:hypothetical protein